MAFRVVRSAFLATQRNAQILTRTAQLPLQVIINRKAKGHYMLTNGSYLASVVRHNADKDAAIGLRLVVILLAAKRFNCLRALSCT